MTKTTFLRRVLWVSLWPLLTLVYFQLYEHLDFNKLALYLRSGECRYVEPIGNGSEDVALFNNHAFITSGLRYTESEELDGVIGHIYYMDMEKVTNETPKAEKLRIFWGEASKARDFNPHGLKVLKTVSGALQLYVINHEPKGDTVEILEVNLEKLTAIPVKTIRSKNIYNANNLAVLGPEEFYLSNDVFFRNAWLKVLEFHVPFFELGSIVYYNGLQKHDLLVDSSVRMPNGLAMDVKKKHLFVASFSSRSLLIYEIQGNKLLKKIMKIPLGTLPDNVFYDEELHGVFIGCHPVGYQLIQLLKNPKTAKAPSQVIFVRFNNRARFDDYTIVEIFSDGGNFLKASTVAARYKKHLLIGTVYDRLMLCDIRV